MSVVRDTRVADATESALITSGLKTAAVLNMMTNTIVGRWDLNDTDKRAPEEAAFFSYSNGHDESVIGEEDGREPVDLKDISAGGAYRCKYRLNYPRGLLIGLANSYCSRCETLPSLSEPESQRSLGNGHGMAHQRQHHGHRWALCV